MDKRARQGQKKGAAKPHKYERDDPYSGDSTRRPKKKFEPMGAPRPARAPGSAVPPARQAETGQRMARTPGNAAPSAQRDETGSRPARAPRYGQPSYRQAEAGSRTARTPGYAAPSAQREETGSRPARAPRYAAPSAQHEEIGPRITRAPRYAQPSTRQAVAGPRPARAPESPVPRARQVEDRPRPEVREVPENVLAGRNPIREALKAGRTIDKLWVVTGELSGSAREIMRMARDAHIVVSYVDKAKLDEVYEKHQGMIAFCAAADYASVDEILECAKEREEQPFIIVLDGITDPHNLGAIIRTAECAGAHGVIIPERRSAALNPAAAKAAAGALEYLKIARVTNLVKTLEELKEKGVWIIGGTMDGEDAFSADLSGPIALVIGAEGDGVSALVKKTLDRAVTLPIKGKIDSLNASVAAGVLLFQIMNARGR